MERTKNWEYTIEENDEWERKKRRKERNADFEFHGMRHGTVHVQVGLTGFCFSICLKDEEQQARRRYKKDLVHLKPDLATYNKQKEVALGLTPGSIKAGPSSSSSNAITAFNPGTVSSFDQNSLFMCPNYIVTNRLSHTSNSKPQNHCIEMQIHCCTPTTSPVKRQLIVLSTS